MKCHSERTSKKEKRKKKSPEKRISKIPKGRKNSGIFENLYQKQRRLVGKSEEEGPGWIRGKHPCWQISRTPKRKQKDRRLCSTFASEKRSRLEAGGKGGDTKNH